MARELTPDFVMDTVDRIMSPRLRWGTLDCTMAAATVFSLLHGIDPLAELRGRYASPSAAARLIKKEGGMLAFGARLASRCGLRDGIGLTGEIGVSPLGFCAGPWERAALICIKSGAWAAKTVDGFAILPRAERSWRA